MKKLLFALSVGAMLALSAVAAADNTLNVGADKIYQVIEYDAMPVILAGNDECTACHANQAGKENSETAMTMERTTQSVNPSEGTGILGKHYKAVSLTMLAERWQ